MVYTIYKTWLPNASAYLSFRHIGGGQHSRLLNENQQIAPVFVEPPKSACVCLSYAEERNLPEWTQFPLSSSSDRTAKHFLLMQGEISEGTSAPSKSLEGVIYSIPLDYKLPLSQLHKQFEGSAGKNISADFEELIRADRKCWIDAYQNEKRFADKDKILPLIAMRFRLDGDGCLRMQSVLNADADQSTPSERTEGKMRAFEMYSFIRDAFHKHKFHDSSEDSIIQLQPVNGDYDFSWIQETAKCLHRTVVSANRDFSDGSIALGKLAYLKAFYSAIEHKKRQEYLPHIHFESLKESIEASRIGSHLEEQNKASNRAIFVSLLGILLALILGLFAFSQIPCIDQLSYEEIARKVDEKSGEVVLAQKCAASNKFSVPKPYIDALRVLLGNIDILILSIFLFSFLLVIRHYRIYQRLFNFILNRRKILIFGLQAPTLYLVVSAASIVLVVLFLSIEIAKFIHRLPAW